MSKFIDVQNIWFSYPSDYETQPTAVLKNFSVGLNEGEFIAILGHNGCGKSTLAKHFNAVLVPSAGKVYVDGIDTLDEDKLFDIRQKVGMVFQNPDNQIVATIVEEDVAFGLENIGVEPSEIRKRVDDAIEIVGMSEYKEHAPHHLSGGQKQRVAIAGIIAMRPKCIVLDEPTAMLDPMGRQEVISTIKKLNKEYGITVILITHYMDEAAKADRVIVMDKGKIILNDAPKNVFSNVKMLKDVGLDVPQTTELAYEMRQLGYKMPNDILTEEECIEEVIKLLEENNARN